MCHRERFGLLENHLRDIREIFELLDALNSQKTVYMHTLNTV